jgi:hypothetical protein
MPGLYFLSLPMLRPHVMGLVTLQNSRQQEPVVDGLTVTQIPANSLKSTTPASVYVNTNKSQI